MDSNQNEFDLVKGNARIRVKIIDGEDGGKVRFDVISGGTGTVHTDTANMLFEIERMLGGKTTVTHKHGGKEHTHSAHHHHH
jgi:hypothetical protein